MEDIILKYEKLIWSIVNKYKSYFDKDDLFQVGVIGLINAYKNYDKKQNTKFSSYAYFYIFGEIKKYISESYLFKVSKELVKINTLVEKAKVLLSQKLQREPSYFEIALYLEIDEEKILEAKEATSLVESLDYKEEDEFSLYENINTSYNEKMISPEILDLKKGIESSNFDVDILMYNLVTADMNEVLSEINQCSGLLLGSPTLLSDTLPQIWTILTSLNPVIHKGLSASCFGSYGWSGEALKNINERYKQLKLNVVSEPLGIIFKPSENNLKDAYNFGLDFAKKVLK